MKWYLGMKNDLYVAALSNKGFYMHSLFIQKQYPFSVLTDHLTVKLLQNIFHNSDLHPGFWVRKVSDFDNFFALPIR